MMISEVREKVKKFLKEALGAEGIKIVMVEKDDAGWVAEAEVVEVNQYLASIKPDYRVFEKELYIVKLDTKLEVSSYKRKGESEEEKED